MSGPGRFDEAALLARHDALLERVTVLERALEAIEGMAQASKTGMLSTTAILEVTRRALDA